MQILCLVWGVLAFIGMVIGFVGCLRSLDFLTFPFAIVGVALSVIAILSSRPRGSAEAIAGLLANFIAAAVSALRLWWPGSL